jgi:hypothetical protein
MDCFNSMQVRLDKFAALPAADRALLLRSLILIAGVRIALWILPFRTIHRWTVNTASRARKRAPLCRRPIPVLTTIVQVVARRVPDASCLTQALATQILLAQAGHPSALRIGVQRDAGKFKAHAWVECGGRIVIGDVPGLDEFTVLPGI